MEPLQEWSRFWIASDDEAREPRVDTAGFLRVEAGLDTLETMDARCAVLLGEPGIGKSVQLERWAAGQSDAAVLYDLGSFDSGDFSDKIERNPLLSLSGDAPVLCLDGLDEALCTLPGLPKRLTAYLLNVKKRAAAPRLRLVCRTAVWDRLEWLSGRLRSIYGDEYRCYSLAPLRREDVSQEILDVVEPMGAEALVPNPLTLELLRKALDVTASSDSLTRKRLYQVCLKRMFEPTAERKTAPRQTTAEQRAEYAQELAVKGLLGGALIENIDDVLHQETLDTQVFKGTRWAHHTFAEFLAAQRLAAYENSSGGPKERRSRRLIRLLAHPEDPRGGIVPQLAGIAGWLAVMSPPVFAHLLKVEPDLLLDIDLVSTTDHQRSQLVDRLLDASGIELPLHVLGGESLARLAHPGILKQLQSRIEDAAGPAASRRMAIRIATRVDRTTDLKSSLLARLRDQEEEAAVRVAAASALQDVRLEREEAEEIKGLLDTDDAELRGNVLSCLWRHDHIDTADLVEHLRSPAYRAVIDSYSLFEYELAGDLDKASQGIDVGPLLDWLLDQVKQGRRLRHSASLARAIVAAALKAPDWRRYVDGVATLGLRASDPEWELPQLESVEKRRVLVAAMVRQLSARERSFVPAALDALVPRQARDEARDELRWLLERLRAGDEEQIPLWSSLVGLVLDDDDQESWSAIAIAADDPVVSAALEPLLRTDLATTGRRRREERERSRRAQRERESARAKLQDLRDAVAEDPAAEYWLDVAEHAIGEGLNDRLSEASIWRDASEAARDGIIASALRFVEETDPRTFVSPLGNEAAVDAIRGAMAIELVREQGRLDQLRDADLDAWAPSILFVGCTLAKLRNELGKRRPERVARIVISWLDAANTESERRGALDHVRDAWVAPMASDLLRRAEADDRWRPQMVGILLRHGVEGAKAVAVSEDGRPPPDLIPVWLAHQETSEAAWKMVLESPESDARDIVGRFAWGISDESPLFDHLPSSLRGQVYQLLVRLYPRAEDIVPRGTVPEGWYVQQLRDAFVASLVRDGEVEALRKIRADLPEAGWLGWAIRDAAKIARQQWKPLSVDEIGALLRDNGRALVRGSSELLQRVVEVFEDLQKDLGSDVAIAARFRNDNGEPKNEDAISTELRRVIADALSEAVTDREPCVNPLEGAKSAKADIKVEVPGEPLARVVIEVKGSWNREARTALKSQLVGKYLQREFRHGLHLVVWFDDDHISKFRPVAALRSTLRQDAQELADDLSEVETFVLEVPGRRTCEPR